MRQEWQAMTVRSDVITAEVLWTEYEATKTRSGKKALLVSYHTKFEVVKQWLYPGSTLGHPA